MNTEIRPMDRILYRISQIIVSYPDQYQGVCRNWPRVLESALRLNW